MLRRLAMAAFAATLGLGTLGARAEDTITQFRVGILGGENTQDRLARYDKFQQLLSQHLGIPVKLFPAADYAGVMQGIAAGQLEAAEFGASGFAGAWLDCRCLEPVVVPTEKDGSTFYYSVMVVRADSGVNTLADMRGHSLAWADPNSTSGYLIPSATLKARPCISVSSPIPSRSGCRTWLSPAKLRLASNSAPDARTTRVPVACA